MLYFKGVGAHGGTKEYKAFIARSPEMEEDMVRFRRLSKEESYQMWEEAKEKARLIQAARENQAFEQGMEKERQQVVLNMLKEKADLAFISKVTGFSIKKITKLKTGSSK